MGEKGKRDGEKHPAFFGTKSGGSFDDFGSLDFDIPAFYCLKQCSGKCVVFES